MARPASLPTFSVEGTRLNEQRIAQYVADSVMLVTALSPVIGHQASAHIAEAALAQDQTWRQAALASGKVTEQQFDEVVDPQDMVGTGVAGA